MLTFASRNISVDVNENSQMTEVSKVWLCNAILLPVFNSTQVLFQEEEDLAVGAITGLTRDL